MPTTSDKARWDKANEQLYRGALRGAKAGETEFPEMELDELTLKWASVPVFDRDGTAFSDSKEPGTTPFISEARFKRRTATLE
jgi:hypothetical protein